MISDVRQGHGQPGRIAKLRVAGSSPVPRSAHSWLKSLARGVQVLVTVSIGPLGSLACSAPIHPPAESPPWFAVTFAAMLLGIPVLLVAGAMLRNALLSSLPAEGGNALDRALENGSWLSILALVAIAVGYPIIALGRPKTLLHYLLFWLGALMVFGPMIYWAWWHGQLPGQ
jgi:hypothetical protein